MWGNGDHASFVPDSLEEDDFQVIYGGQEEEDKAEPERARRPTGPRYAFPQAGSAVKPGTAGAGARAADGGQPGDLLPLWQQPAAAAASQAPAVGVSSPGGSGGNSPAAASSQQAPVPTLVQELQSVLHSLTQREQQQQQQQQGGAQPGADVQQQLQQLQQQQADLGSGRQPRSGGLRHIMLTSPEIPESQLQPAPPASSGRRWRRPLPPPPNQPGGRLPGRSPTVQASAQPAATAGVAAGAGAGAGGAEQPAAISSFFSLDADLLQAHAQRQALQQGPPGHARQQRRQQRAVLWNSPQPPAVQQLPPPPQHAQQQAAAEHTPLPTPASQRINPLAALLGPSGGGGSSASRQRPAHAGKMRGRHPLYGAGGGSTPSSVGGGNGRVGGDIGSSTSSTTSAAGAALRDTLFSSPGQPHHRRAPQHQQSRFSIRDPAADAAAAPGAAAAAAAAGGGQDAGLGAAAGVPGPVPVPGTAAGLRQLVGGEPASAQRQQHFCPRPQRLPCPEDSIEIEEEDEEEWGLGEGAGQQQGSAADGFRTPGQPLRQRHQQQQEVQQGPEGSVPGSTAAAAAAAGGLAAGPTPGSSRCSPGSAGGDNRPVSLQRQFIAQLQPVSRPAAAATMQQQRQRLTGAAGLHARIQAILAAEKAGLQAAQSPSGAAAGRGGPRLTVMEKELEGSISKCLCRCEGTAAQALGSPQVVALLQSRTAREVDTAPGSVLVLREPWVVIPVEGSQWPAVLCYSAAMG